MKINENLYNIKKSSICLMSILYFVGVFCTACGNDKKEGGGGGKSQDYNKFEVHAYENISIADQNALHSNLNNYIQAFNKAALTIAKDLKKTYKVFSIIKETEKDGGQVDVIYIFTEYQVIKENKMYKLNIKHNKCRGETWPKEELTVKKEQFASKKVGEGYTEIKLPKV